MLGSVKTSAVTSFVKERRDPSWVAQPGGRTGYARKLVRSHAPLSVWVQWSLLLAVVPLAVWFAQRLTGVELPVLHSRGAVLMAVVGILVTYPVFGVFQRLRSLPTSLLFLTLGWLAVVLEIEAALAYLGLASLFNAPVLVAASGLVLLGQTLSVSLSHWLFLHNAAGSRGRVPVLVVGTGRLAQDLIAALSSNPYLPDQVVGLVVEDDCSTHRSEILQLLDGDIEQSVGIDRLALVARKLLVERIYIALPFEHMHRLAEIQAKLEDLNIDVVWAPDVEAVNALNPALRELAGMPLVSLSESPMNCIGSAYVKSLLDVIVGTLALVMCSPVLLLAALAVKISSPGPVIYRQQRHGWDGGVFQIWKFRSMYVEEAEAVGDCVPQAKPEDARVTSVGRFLRRSSIDELPQLFNVLKGDMSLVGPRPHAVSHNLDYAKSIATYMSRHRIKPGITGLAQISGLRGETATVDKMRARVEQDLRYINSWSIWLDLWILLKTPAALLKNKNVY